MSQSNLDTLENTFIEQQLSLAEQAYQQQGKTEAMVFYAAAYDEALWLCEHYIDQCDDAVLAKEAYDYLSTASRGYLRCIDSPAQAEQIKSRLLGVSMRLSTEFDLDLNERVLADLNHSSRSFLPLKLSFFRSVFA